MGNTGDAEGTPYHLHFEVHPVSLLYLGYDGAVDPTPYLDAWKHQQDLPFPIAAGWAPAIAGARSRRPSRARSCSAMNDISTADGLDPASLERALTPLDGVSADADARSDAVPRRRPTSAAASRDGVATRPGRRSRADSRRRTRLAAAEHVLHPLARLRAGDRVEEDAERDAGDEQRRVAAAVRPSCPGAGRPRSADRRSPSRSLSRTSSSVATRVATRDRAARCRSARRTAPSPSRTRSARRRAASRRVIARSTYGLTLSAAS